MKKRNFAYILLGLLVTAFFLVIIIFLFIKYPPFEASSYNIDTLSDYGRDDMSSSEVFNAMLFISGIGFSLFNWGILKRFVGMRILKVLGIITSASVSFVGIFNLPSSSLWTWERVIHWTFALIFLFGFPATMLLISFFAYRKAKEKLYLLVIGISSISIFGQLIMYFLGGNFRIIYTELFGVFMLLVWVAIVSVFMVRSERKIALNLKC